MNITINTQAPAEDLIECVCDTLSFAKMARLYIDEPFGRTSLHLMIENIDELIRSTKNSAKQTRRLIMSAQKCAIQAQKDAFSEAKDNVEKSLTNINKAITIIKKIAFNPNTGNYTPKAHDMAQGLHAAA